jgi:hypothetical protein
MEVLSPRLERPGLEPLPLIVMCGSPKQKIFRDYLIVVQVEENVNRVIPDFCPLNFLCNHSFIMFHTLQQLIWIPDEQAAEGNAAKER